MGTRVTVATGAAFPRAGQTIWAGSAASGEAGMAWDWVEIGPGVVAMADPLAVITNLRVLGDEGEVLTAYDAARWLNHLVHRLPWQDAVGRALSTRH